MASVYTFDNNELQIETKSKNGKIEENEREEKSKEIRYINIVIETVIWNVFVFGLKYIFDLIGPVKRGFFCDDPTIRYPYRESTVSSNALYLYMFLVVFVPILIVELYRLYKIDMQQCFYSVYETKKPLLQRLIIRIFIFYGYFQIAFGIAHILTNLTKISVGTLRPHFLYVCQPNIDTKFCNHTLNLFVDNYTCMNKNVNSVEEARRSFFSGHSSLAMVASAYSVLYLQHRLLKILPIQVIVPTLQTIIISMGMFISYSRIFDYKHHWEDVACGMAAGVFCAWITVNFIGKWYTRKDKRVN